MCSIPIHIVHKQAEPDIPASPASSLLLSALRPHFLQHPWGLLIPCEGGWLGLHVTSAEEQSLNFLIYIAILCSILNNSFPYNAYQNLKCYIYLWNNSPLAASGPRGQEQYPLCHR